MPRPLKVQRPSQLPHTVRPREVRRRQHDQHDPRLAQRVTKGGNECLLLLVQAVGVHPHARQRLLLHVSFQPLNELARAVAPCVRHENTGPRLEHAHDGLAGDNVLVMIAR